MQHHQQVAEHPLQKCVRDITHAEHSMLECTIGVPMATSPPCLTAIKHFAAASGLHPKVMNESLPPGMVEPSPPSSMGPLM